VSGEAAVVAWKGDVDLIRAPSLRNELMAAVDNRHAGLVIDLTEVNYLDSAAVNVLFEVAEELRQHQLGFAVVVPPESLVEKVVTMVDLRSVARLHGDLAAALAQVREQG
jgi:anti-anti-sigma factor